MKIAIAGFGAEGKANYDYWATPENEVVIVDERAIPATEIPTDANVIVGEAAFTKLKGFDMVVRTAGLAPRKIVTDGAVWSATNEFFAKCPAPIIGVTGSKGKGTTCSWIASILRAAGKTVHLVGNIGVPALSVLPNITEEAIVVYELSSFQLWDIERSPQVAVVLYIEPDHLDVHESFEEYVAAKARIASYQLTTDRVVYNKQNQWAAMIARQSVGQRLPYPSERTAHVRGDAFFYGEQELCTLDNILLPGAHNLDNACAAITAIWPWVQDGAVIAEGVRSFAGLPHRLKFVREVNGVNYYDDSIATTPGSAIAAVSSFDERVTLILGGHDKGGDLTELMRLCRDRQVSVIAIGANRQQIAELSAKYDVACNVEPGDMQAIVRRASAEAERGSVVVLSPAAASFDMFKSYIDRGEQFIAAVDAL